MKKTFNTIIRSKILLLFTTSFLAIIFSIFLVYVQLMLFWPNADVNLAYSLGFWTALIDSLIIVIFLIYLKTVHEKRLKNIIKIKNKRLSQKNKELENLNKTLEKRVEEQTSKNRVQELKLFEQTKMASLGQMIANIAHQWRQPLSVITANASGIKLKKDFNSLDDIFLEQSLDSINENANYLSNTIDVFRNFTKETKEFKEVILQDRINIAIDIVKATLSNNHIRLIDNINYEKPIYISLITGELSETLINILNNAKDALMEKKDGEKWIKIDLKKHTNNVVISIEDNAGGIPEDIINKIFEPYFTTKHSSIGTGLGLHMSYEIVVNSLKGDLSVKNTQFGAKFKIKLPLNLKSQN